MTPMTPDELREAIALRGPTQEAFSKRVRIPTRTLRRYLAGDPIPDQTAMLIRIVVARRNWEELLAIGSRRPIKFALGLSLAD